MTARREAVLDRPWEKGTSSRARAWSLGPEPCLSAGAGLPPSGELHFWVKEAQGLVPQRSGTLDSYVQW